MKLLLRFASGPLTFLVFYFVPYEGPSPEGRVVLAIFGWMVMWWMTQPVPWAITSLLPLLLFPGFALMSIGNTVSLYGQNIFFWIMGTILMGYAMHRHGLAKRFALWFLSLRVVSGSTHRLVFGFMLVTAIWIVPPTVLLLLFSTPVNWRKAEFVLTWREAAEHAPWNIMILCTAAVAVIHALAEFGFVQFAEGLVAGMGLGHYSLPFVSAPLVAFSTNFLSGTASTALFAAVLIPASQ